MKKIAYDVPIALMLYFLAAGCAVAQDAFFAGFDWASAKIHARNLPHPRSFPAGTETRAVFEAANAGERSKGFAALMARLDRGPISPSAAQLIRSTRSAATADAKATVILVVKNAVLADANLAQEAGFAALVTGATKYRLGAMQVMRALADLDPRAETSVAKEDLSAMLILRTLALGIDWFYSYWTPEERQVLTRAIIVRMEDFATKLVRGPSPLEKNPLVSHDNEVLAGLAETAVILLGELPLADQWFDEFVPLYARLLTPFGGADGGYANGTAYASWDVGEYSLRQWDTLRRAIGLDLTQKTWAQNFGRYLAYFLPPGTPVGLFGNGTEVSMPETWARYAKAYATRVPTPLNRWYARQWFQEDPSRLELLTGPLAPISDAPYPTGTPDAAYFPSIGWVAMHSSLQDRGRTSMYFKSSPYGSVSHSHADQNSFVLNAGGRQLLVASGYYDYFGSRHHFGWTTRTIAQNAITFDQGLGQDNPAKPWGDAAAKGSITAFSTSSSVDLAVGDATAAYRGQLKQATRGVVYLRPNVFVVFDKLESVQPRIWEWNLHALNRMEQLAAGSLAINSAEQKACVHLQSNTPTSFSQTDTFTVPPIRTQTDPRPNQWHGQFVSSAATTRFWAVAVIEVGCAPSNPTVRFESTTSTVQIGAQTFEFDGQKIRVKN